VGLGGRSVYRICINVSRYCDQKGTLSVKHSQARNLCICSHALYHIGVARPHKAELDSCSSFSERNVCSVASVESNFTHVLLYIKKLPIISTVSMNIWGCRVLLENTCNHFCKSCFQKGKKHVEKMAS